MSTPTIKSRMQLDGGREFKDMIAANSRELRVIGSELGKVDIQYQSNTKSVEGLTKKSELLDRTLVSQKERVTLLRAEYEKANKTYGESDKRTQGLAIQLNNAEAAAYKTENALKANKNQLDGMSSSTVKASDLLGQLTGKLGISLPDGVLESVDSMFQFDAAAAVMVSGLVAGAAAVFALEKKLYDLTAQQGKAADELQTQGLKYGVDPVTLQEWNYAAKFIDTSSDTMFSSITKLTRTMGEARDGNEELQQKFKDLGIEYDDHNGKLLDSKAVFFEVIDALGGMENSTDRDTVAMKLMGKSAMDLNPLILAGSEGIRKYSKEAHDLGVIASNDTVTGIAAVDDSMERLNSKLEAGNNLIADKMGPSTIKFNERLGDLLQTGTELLVDSGFLDIMTAMMDTISGTFPLVEATWNILKPVAQSTLKPIALGLAVIADALTVIVNVLALIIESVRWLINFGQGKYNFQKYGNNATNAVINGATANLIKNYASGTDYHPGGLAMINEEGPELIDLPRGSRVIPHRKSMQMLRNIPAYAGGIGSFGGDTFIFNVSANEWEQLADIIRIAKERRMSVRLGFAGR
jgi:hypothetical protein